MLRLNAEALTRFHGDEVEGQVSFGAPDDFGTRFLPNILGRFARTHPNVEVNVSLGPSSDLLHKLDSDELDLTIVTTCEGGSHGPGRLVFSEPLVWVGVRHGRAKDKPVLSLALAGQSCAWRTMALAQLNQMERPYRIAYTCENCQGQMAALMADLAVAPLPLSLLTSGLERLTEADGLPKLQNYEVRLLERNGIGSAGKAFATHVIDSFAQVDQMQGQALVT
jgi:DNA-binding transcriptional LysR family regulator